MVIFSSESRISSDSALGSIAVHLQLKLKETLQRFHERRRAGKKINVSCMFKVQHTMFQKVKKVSFFKKSKSDCFLRNSTLLKKSFEKWENLKMFQPLCKWWPASTTSSKSEMKGKRHVCEKFTRDAALASRVLAAVLFHCQWSFMAHGNFHPNFYFISSLRFLRLVA